MISLSQLIWSDLTPIITTVKHNAHYSHMLHRYVPYLPECKTTLI